MGNRLKDKVTAEIMRQQMTQRFFEDSLNGFNPAAIIQNTTKMSCQPASPIEHFSPEKPVCKDDKLVPIDEVLGRYYPKQRGIKIYYGNIEHFAHRSFKCDAIELERIVRLHEYAHGIVHLGTYLQWERDSLTTFDDNGLTDWKSQLRTKYKKYISISDRAHELLAQAITWLSLNRFENSQDSIEIFLKVMEFQPEEYRLNKEILEKITPKNLFMAIDYIRSNRIFSKGYSIYAFLKAIIQSI